MPLADRRDLQQQHRPDGVLYTPQDPAGYAMKFIEVKYCRDTDPEAQTIRADAQHGPTIREINQYYERARIKLVTLLVGVSGAIHKQTLDRLTQDLGVDRKSAQLLAKKLNLFSVQALNTIWKYRQRKAGTTPQMRGNTRRQARRPPDREKPP